MPRLLINISEKKKGLRRFVGWAAYRTTSDYSEKGRDQQQLQSTCKQERRKGGKRTSQCNDKAPSFAVPLRPFISSQNTIKIYCKRNTARKRTSILVRNRPAHAAAFCHFAI